MARAVLLLFALFALLTVLRGLRIFFEAVRRRGAAGRPPSPTVREGDMVRDPVCGTWIDRRLALPVRRGGETLAVCSETCRRSLEAAP
jgi:YHS domain-containing protein